MTKIKKLGAVTVASALMITGTAQAACWTPAEADAAKVRDLQMRLMVSALRCSKSQDNFLSEYNSFIRNKRSLLTVSNKLIRSHFGKGKTERQGLNAYDRYSVSLANHYGAGTGDFQNCAKMKAMAVTANASNGNMKSLVRVAYLNGLSPKLPGGRCGTEFAANK